MTCPLEQLPKTVSDCRREAEQILERTEGAIRLRMQSARSISREVRSEVATNPIEAASHHS